MSEDSVLPLVFHRTMVMGFQQDWSFADEVEAEDFWVMQNACSDMRFALRNPDRL